MGKIPNLTLRCWFDISFTLENGNYGGSRVSLVKNLKIRGKFCPYLFKLFMSLIFDNSGVQVSLRTPRLILVAQSYRPLAGSPIRAGEIAPYGLAPKELLRIVWSQRS